MTNEQYLETTGNEPRHTAPSRDSNWDSYFEQSFEAIDDLTLSLTSEVTHG